jgi:hypothetical protein
VTALSLQGDLDAAVRAAGGPANQGLGPDGGWATIVPVNTTGCLAMRARMSASGEYFSLEAPLATLEEHASPEVLRSLLRRNLEADHGDGATYAVVSEEEGDVVVAVYHWVLPSIAPAEFAGVLKVFARAVRALRSDLADLSAAGAAIGLIEPATFEEVAAMQGRGAAP